MLKRSLLLFSLLISLSACPAQPKQSDYAVLIRDIGNPYWKTVYDSVVETAKALDMNVYIQTLTEENDAEGQLNQCQNALLRKPKALIFSAVNSVNLSPCLQEAYAQDVLLVDMDGNLTQEQAKAMNVELAFSVASNNYELGKKAADYIKGKTGKALVLEGHPGSQPGILRAKGFTENVPNGVDIVASISGDWDRLKAADITADILNRHPDLAIVFAANDMMALGAVETLRAAGRDDVMVIGVDAVADAIQAIKDGRLTASIAQLPYLIAKEALAKAKAKIEDGADYTFMQYVPVLTIDKSVLDSDEPLLKYLR